MNPLKTILAASLVAGMAFTASALEFTTINNPVSVNFSGFQGTYASLPTGVTFTTGQSERDFFNYDSPPTLTLTGMYAFRESSSDPVIGFVHRRGTGSPASQFFNITITNNTGETVTDFQLSLDFLQITEGSRDTEIQMNWNPAGSGFTTTGISNGGAFFAQADTSQSSVVLLNPYLSTSRTINYTYATGINDGQTVVFGFNIRNGSGTGNNAHVGFSNISVTAIPEPGTIAALIGLGAFGLVVYVRRRRQVA